MASAVARTICSLMLQANLFQLFHPMGGVSASWSSVWPGPPASVPVAYSRAMRSDVIGNVYRVTHHGCQQKRDRASPSRRVSMTMNESHRCRLNEMRVMVVALVAAAGCIRLPSNEVAGATTVNADRSKPPLVVWDGDKHGGSAKEWSNCNLKGACESSVKVAPATGIGGSNALEWHTKGKDWKGFGWNWFGFYPEDAGTDVTKYQNLVFWIRLKVDDPKAAPDLKDLKVGLASSNKVESETVPLLSYVDGIADNQWHE